MMMKIETTRLLLRPIVLSDDADIFEYSKNINVGPNAGWKPHESIEETRRIMKTVFLDKEGVFGIILKSTNKLIGSVGLICDPKRENDKARMIGYALSADYWGNGYMSEAVGAVIEYGFHDLKLDLISAYCYPHNFRSKKVLNKFGFQYEGTLCKCEKLYNDKVCDNECYMLLKK
jgi:putative acetyltransferase